MNAVEQFQKNTFVFRSLLEAIRPELIIWRPRSDKWCLLEIVCHLYDEERLDFRLRTQWVLEKPCVPPPPFNPLDWVKDHNYMEQDFDEMVSKFINERDVSIKWLKSLENPNWSSSYHHEKQGELTAMYYLTNWLAHDYLHTRQILKLKFGYLQHQSGENLDYAGVW